MTLRIMTLSTMTLQNYAQNDDIQYIDSQHNENQLILNPRVMILCIQYPGIAYLLSQCVYYYLYAYLDLYGVYQMSMVVYVYGLDVGKLNKMVETFVMFRFKPFFAIFILPT